MTFCIKDTQHKGTQYIIRYAECRYAESRYAECRYAESRYAECRGGFRGPLKYEISSLGLYYKHCYDCKLRRYRHNLRP